MDARPALRMTVRLEVLRVLRDHGRAQGDRGGGIDTHLDEDVLLRVLSLRGLPLTRGELREDILLYLRGRGHVEFREIRVGSQVFVHWRIETSGMQLLEGTVADPGVASA